MFSNRILRRVVLIIAIILSVALIFAYVNIRQQDQVAKDAQSNQSLQEKPKDSPKSQKSAVENKTKQSDSSSQAKNDNSQAQSNNQSKNGTSQPPVKQPQPTNQVPQSNGSIVAAGPNDAIIPIIILSLLFAEYWRTRRQSLL